MKWWGSKKSFARKTFGAKRVFVAHQIYIKKVFHISRKSCRQLLREIQFCAQNFCVKSYAHLQYN
ncbi:MAG: hypothetical protein DRR00_03275 [Candidatus Parabeggiatoa sp. nov. 3]|nr:MAG: hypothetical protein DRR00_03275 [Gammaproteobacteria bacterium]RKZ62597.1 MAG: hypothetical protein DRQ99_18470 [Gammaproteobacteria bacterium]